jgi:hypothetical protein
VARFGCIQLLGERIHGGASLLGTDVAAVVRLLIASRLDAPDRTGCGSKSGRLPGFKVLAIGNVGTACRSDECTDTAQERVLALQGEGMRYDIAKVEEAVLALLGVFEFENGRVWKRFNFDVMDSLHAQGYITDPKFLWAS